MGEQAQHALGTRALFVTGCLQPGALSGVERRRRMPELELEQGTHFEAVRAARKRLEQLRRCARISGVQRDARADRGYALALLAIEGARLERKPRVRWRTHCLWHDDTARHSLPGIDFGKPTQKCQRATELATQAKCPSQRQRQAKRPALAVDQRLTHCPSHAASGSALPSASATSTALTSTPSAATRARRRVRSPRA